MSRLYLEQRPAYVMGVQPCRGTDRAEHPPSQAVQQAQEAAAEAERAAARTKEAQAAAASLQEQVAGLQRQLQVRRPVFPLRTSQKPNRSQAGMKKRESGCSASFRFGIKCAP